MHSKPLFLAIAIALLASAGTASSGRAASATLSYGYDAAGRLTAATYAGAQRVSYQYDRQGSLLARRPTADLLAPLAGTFNGLITSPMAAIDTIGPITLKLQAAGGFSGSLTLGGQKVSFTGVFNADGSTAPIGLGARTLQLTLDVAGGSQSVTGMLLGGGSLSMVWLGRAAYHPTQYPVPAGLVGKFTALLAPTDPNTTLPQGDGYATGTITVPGGVRVAGKLPEGTAFTQSSTLSGPAAAWPFFASLYQKAGHVSGIIRFQSEPGTSDFSGPVTWLKPVTSGPVHSSAFTTALAFLGSHYRVPVRGQRVLEVREAAPNASFRTLGGDLAIGAVVVPVHLDANNRYQIEANPVTLKLKTVSGTGLTTGSFKDGTITRTFGGVVLPAQNLASGYFLGPTLSGAFEVTPQ
jgi:YD repeat-containing protein